MHEMVRRRLRSFVLVCSLIPALKVSLKRVDQRVSIDFFIPVTHSISSMCVVVMLLSMFVFCVEYLLVGGRLCVLLPFRV